MSVINQMLKDLDKRQQEQVNPLTANAAITDSKPRSQRWVIIILILLLIISLGVIVWQKWGIRTNETLSKNTVIGNNITSGNNTVPDKVMTESTLPEQEQSKKQREKDNIETIVTSPNNDNEPNIIEAENLAATTVTKNVNGNLESDQSLMAQQKLIEQEKPEIKQSLEKIGRGENREATIIVEQAEKELAQSIEPTLTISRRQLTPDQLAIKKIAQAEQAIADQDIKRAEQLLEEVLLVVPSHKFARKQLAALWFGKQSYQAALNLLSQGLALDNQDVEFRLMKARIYLSQGQTKSAYDELVVLDDLRLVEYQSVLASTAQQLSLFSAAEKAYNILTQLAPNIGRWWLGLGIAQDSQGYFKQAKMSYQNALKLQDLSNETAQFAKNRIVELGE
ncbi:tetratricopeptide repeat protein [Thalassotalea profundi]|uniref:MSHA biogenesis protein MshN n=1 Tax=Thalassotalea profundi TaxID=2036687 RepID=A0ABQ3IZD6_9GAMM|nr:tetratricopeptide repeat protein [Thalassotalea profundi]GHE99118.1 MSHA biogenesis protein MshN [Thalassotalea profundi]